MVGDPTRGADGTADQADQLSAEASESHSHSLTLLSLPLLLLLLSLHPHPPLVALQSLHKQEDYEHTIRGLTSRLKEVTAAAASCLLASLRARDRSLAVHHDWLTIDWSVAGGSARRVRRENSRQVAEGSGSTGGPVVS